MFRRSTVAIAAPLSDDAIQRREGERDLRLRDVRLLLASATEDAEPSGVTNSQLLDAYAFVSADLAVLDSLKTGDQKLLDEARQLQETKQEWFRKHGFINSNPADKEHRSVPATRELLDKGYKPRHRALSKLGRTVTAAVVLARAIPVPAVASHVIEATAFVVGLREASLRWRGERVWRQYEKLLLDRAKGQKTFDQSGSARHARSDVFSINRRLEEAITQRAINDRSPDGLVRSRARENTIGLRPSQPGLVELYDQLTARSQLALHEDPTLDTTSFVVAEDSASTYTTLHFEQLIGDRFRTKSTDQGLEQ